CVGNMRTEVPLFAAMPCAMARSSPLFASSHCLPQGSRLRRLSRSQADYSRDLHPAKWVSGNALHGNNPKPLMSALGQKQTFRNVRPMSALPPKADIAECDRQKSALLFPLRSTRRRADPWMKARPTRALLPYAQIEIGCAAAASDKRAEVYQRWYQP